MVSAGDSGLEEGKVNVLLINAVGLKKVPVCCVAGGIEAVAEGRGGVGVGEPKIKWGTKIISPLWSVSERRRQLAARSCASLTPDTRLKDFNVSAGWITYRTQPSGAPQLVGVTVAGTTAGGGRVVIEIVAAGLARLVRDGCKPPSTRESDRLPNTITVETIAKSSPTSKSRSVFMQDGCSRPLL
jgi:hypothetical protein